MGMMSRRKGKLGEQEAAALLRPAFPLVRSKRAGGETLSIDRGRDLLDTPGYCVQVMLSKQPNIHRKLAEAMRCARDGGDVPVALTRRTPEPVRDPKTGRFITPEEPWLATLPASAFVAMVDQLEKLRRNYATGLPAPDAP